MKLRGNCGIETTASANKPGRFGIDIDPVEAGRKGGVASGRARQPKERRRRELEARVLESRNGAAIVKLLALQQERDRLRLEAREFAARARAGVPTARRG